MSKRLTYEYVKEYIESFEGYCLLSTEYKNNSSKLKIKCPKEHIFEMSFANFKAGCRCGECFGKKRKSFNEVKQYIESFNGYKLLSDIYIDNQAKLKIQCPIGHIFEMTYGSFQQNRRCPECAKIIRKQKRFLKYDFVKNFIESESGYILLSETYEYKKSKLTIQCLEGHIFKMSFDKFQLGQRCPICKESKGEQKISDYLTNNNISFQRQYSFDDCRNIEPLRFDFAILNENGSLSFLCEYDGEYHYLPIEGEKKLKYQQKLDNIKNVYCQQNNIPLLRIPYWDFDNIEQILSQELKKHNLKIA